MAAAGTEGRFASNQTKTGLSAKDAKNAKVANSSMDLKQGKKTDFGLSFASFASFAD
jgi:hypothetical protein